MIDFCIVHQTDTKSVKHTRVMCGASATGLSDHRLVRCKLTFSIKPSIRHKCGSKHRRLNVQKLHTPTVDENLCEKITSNLELLQCDIW